MTETVPTAYVLVGLPTAGKTTVARQLEAEHAALRLTPDEWMAPLFGGPEAGGRREVLEGLLLDLAQRALAIGTSVVLDFGFWARSERDAVRARAHRVGAQAEVVYVWADRETLRERMAARTADPPDHTFTLEDAELDRWWDLFEEPDAAELDLR
jgi:predicted kinase